MYKSVFISDTHLGSKHCNAEALLKFLKEVECQNLFLVGDIIDLWRLKRKSYWPKTHTKIVKQIVKLAKSVNVVYILGNHDEDFRDLIDAEVNIGNIQVVSKRYVYKSLNGKKYLVIHGDLFDHLMSTRVGRTVMSLGDFAYDFFSEISKLVSYARKKLGLEYWSLVAYLKKQAKVASNFIGQYETELAKYCKNKGYDGIICGHIHTPTIKDIQEVKYLNTGDWVENNSALVEKINGSWEIIYFK